MADILFSPYMSAETASDEEYNAMYKTIMEQTLEESKIDEQPIDFDWEDAAIASEQRGSGQRSSNAKKEVIGKGKFEDKPVNMQKNQFSTTKQIVVKNKDLPPLHLFAYLYDLVTSVGGENIEISEKKWKLKFDGLFKEKQQGEED